MKFLAAGIACCRLSGAELPLPEPAPLQGRQVCSISVGKQGAGSAIFSPDGSRLLVCGKGVPSLWAIPSGKKVADLVRPPLWDEPSLWNSFSFSGDGSRILAETGRGQNGYFYTVWDAVAGTLLGKTQGPYKRQAVFQGLLSPDGSLFLGRGSVKGWTVHEVTEEGISPSFRPVSEKGKFFTYSPDGGKAAFFDQDGYVAVWDLLQGKELWKKPGRRKGASVDVVRFSKDGSAVFVADRMGECAEIYDLEHHRILEKTGVADRQTISPWGSMFGIVKPFSRICFDPENKVMRKVDLPVSTMRSQLRETSGKLENPFRAKRSADFESNNPPDIFYVTRDGRYAVMAQFSGCSMYNYKPAVLIWDIEKKRASGDVVYWFPFIFYMEISPGEKYLHFHGGNRAPEGVVSFASGTPMKAPGKILAFSADDSMIAWLDGENVRVWKISGNGESGN
ncbi:WD40 repeat domain-containing protein [Akkermansia sp.]|uniref:WD40 repeat domain-containing protein n=1 Tax=Akkermansia sp. TaxID=1872421 RepID=UPI000AAB9B0C